MSHRTPSFPASAETGGHELRLNGVPLGEASMSWRSDDADVQDFVVPAGTAGPLTFSVHALPGQVTGDLLSVQLLRGDE